MLRLKKFNCSICGCESAIFRGGGKYCRKCTLIYGTNKCHYITVKMENNPRIMVSKFFEDTVASMTMNAKQRIAKQLGGFPKTYNEQSELDAKRVEQSDKDAERLAVNKKQSEDGLSSLKICDCCGEKFKSYNFVYFGSEHCAVCRNVFGVESLSHVDKLSDSRKCELYKICRANSNDEVKSMTPPELHQNLPPNLNIRLRPTDSVIALLMRDKMEAYARENKGHEKRPFTCCKCGDTYLLEGEHPKPFICDRCKVYDEEHMRGTKLRDLPGLPSMTYEHLALLPEYAACMFTKHMTSEELARLKKIRAKIRPPKKSFTELIDDV